jgi:hypothetical protein
MAKLKDDVGLRIKEKLDLLGKHSGKKKVASDPLFPSVERDKARVIVENYADIMEEKISELDSLVRASGLHIKYIGDQNKFVAAYLLIGKSLTSLKAALVLVRQGYSFQVVEIVRSSIESLDLVALFLTDGQEELLQKWFGGEIVQNNVARQTLDDAVNRLAVEQNSLDKGIPLKEALSDIYSIYSLYTHSAYSAIFDFIDMFSEDFDFEQNSQFHYSRNYFHLINNLYVRILLALKDYFIHVNDQSYLDKIEGFLLKEQDYFANPGDVRKEFRRYGKR